MSTTGTACSALSTPRGAMARGRQAMGAPQLESEELTESLASQTGKLVSADSSRQKTAALATAFISV